MVYDVCVRWCVLYGMRVYGVVCVVCDVCMCVVFEQLESALVPRARGRI